MEPALSTGNIIPNREKLPHRDAVGQGHRVQDGAEGGVSSHITQELSMEGEALRCTLATWRLNECQRSSQGRRLSAVRAVVSRTPVQ